LSYNGSGVFQINSSGQPVVTGTVISSTAFNALTADLATGLSTAITKDGQTTTTARVPFAQGISSTLTTDATSTTTGSIITAGGISMQKALWVGTTSRHVGATQFDAAITYGGVTLSNAVTGTGNMVLSASPTLTGTVNTQNVQPTADATHNIGGASNRYAGAFAGHLSDGSQAAGEMVGSGGTTMRLANGSGWTGISTTKSLGIGMTPSNVLDITQNQNGNSVVAILNSDGGASATTRYRLRNGTTTSEFQLFGSGFTPTGVYRANGLLVENSGAGGVTINAAAAQPIYFGINSAEVARIDTSGNLKVGTTNAADRNFMFKSVAQGGINFHVLDGNQGSAIFLGCSNAAYNAANAAIWVSQNSATSRSINAGGTINASGADYAEYMTKADGCGAIAKGGIAGVNDDGKLTDKFADAHSFVVKSTDPSYVGGDVWGSVDIMGVRPEFTDPAYTQYAEKLEAARQKVDRIAFSGQVPVNVTGATVGDYIVPVAGPDGGIAGEAVTNPTFDQYRAAVGRVWKILEDGRAFVSVKVS
jgi:hypothetical protein